MTEFGSKIMQSGEMIHDSARTAIFKCETIHRYTFKYRSPGGTVLFLTFLIQYPAVCCVLKKEAKSDNSLLQDGSLNRLQRFRHIDFFQLKIHNPVYYQSKAEGEQDAP